MIFGMWGVPFPFLPPTPPDEFTVKESLECYFKSAALCNFSLSGDSICKLFASIPFFLLLTGISKLNGQKYYT